MKKGQHVGGWIVDFYADGAPEPIETIRQPGEACDGDTRDGLNDAITAADWWALTAQAPGRFYVTAKHSQAPESSRSWAKVDVVNGEPKWVECDEPRFVWQTGGDGITLPGPADGYGWADKALIAFDFTFNHGCRRELVEASRLGTEARGVWEFQVSGWPALMDCGVRRAGLAGVKGHPLAVPRAIIRQREDGTPDITPRHPLADGEVFDPWQAAAETFGVDVDAVKAAAGCPDRWWFVYDCPDDGSELVKAPTKRMAGELSGFMRGSDPPHEFDELTIEPATMDALAERCLAHETLPTVDEVMGKADELATGVKVLLKAINRVADALGVRQSPDEDFDGFADRLETECRIVSRVKRVMAGGAVVVESMGQAAATAVQSPLGRGTEGEMRLIMTLDEPRAIGVYTWTDGHDDPEPYMATPGWWGDCRLPVGGNRDIFSPDDVEIWARLPEQVTP